MKKVNILRIACLASFIAGIIFGGCNKDNDGDVVIAGGGNDGIDKLEISIEDGSDYSSMIDVVKLLSDDLVLAVADYNNGDFSFNLPSNVPTGNLRGIRLVYPSSAISNPNAQITDVRI